MNSLKEVIKFGGAVALAATGFIVKDMVYQANNHPLSEYQSIFTCVDPDNPEVKFHLYAVSSGRDALEAKKDGASGVNR